MILKNKALILTLILSLPTFVRSEESVNPSLSEEQKQEIKKIKENHKEEMNEKKEDLKKAKQALREERKERREEMKKVLTEEQKDQIRKQLKEKREVRRNRHLNK